MPMQLVYGSRTISPWTIAPRTIVPQITTHYTITHRTISPPGQLSPQTIASCPACDFRKPEVHYLN